MELRWLCSVLIILVIISSTTNTQNIVNKWQVNEKKVNIAEQDTFHNRLKSINQHRNYEDDVQVNNKDNVNLFASNQKYGIKRNEIELNLDEKSSKIHSRKKRLVWVTDDGRLALPPGTVLSITPTLSLPLVRYPLSGFLSNITVSFPLTIDFDKLGLTDNENPLGVLPPVFGARSMGRAAGTLLGNYVSSYLNLRSKRDVSSTDENAPNTNAESLKLPTKADHAFHGGERALLYGAVEDFLSTFGVDGKACLLRLICEVHSKSLNRFGLFGEMIKLFFTATKSQYAELLPEYVSAEKIGEGKEGPGECFPYYKDCPKSVFREMHYKYSDEINEKDIEMNENVLNDQNEENVVKNEIDSNFIM